MAKTAFKLGLLAASCIAVAACGGGNSNNQGAEASADAVRASERLANSVDNYIRVSDEVINRISQHDHDRGGPPWYLQEQKPSDLRAALADDLRYLGADNIGYRSMPGGVEICGTLRQIGLPCNYNTRFTLSMFLTVNGKGLFPAHGGTNPYCTEENSPGPSWPDDCFVGHGRQNGMLNAAIRRNAHLFHDGNLTARDVRDHWR